MGSRHIDQNLTAEAAGELWRLCRRKILVQADPRRVASAAGFARARLIS